MPGLVGYLLLFVAIGVGFIFVHLLAGKFIRPAKPHDEKLTIYECGEPTIGSAWVQFDLRFYVVALLFVIFDVEVAFFFPWAVVYGKLTELGKPGLEQSRRIDYNFDSLALPPTPQQAEWLTQRHDLLAQRGQASDKEKSAIDAKVKELEGKIIPDPAANATAARQMSLLAFLDIAVFFGVLLVGFAYLWRRGDLNWVRSMAAEREQPGETAPAEAMATVGSGS
jgi:NADH-quinone oxidoreductase subunit A